MGSSRRKKKYPELPTIVQGAGGPVDIVRSVEMQEHGHMGTYATAERQIRIAGSLKPEVAWMTLFHEIVEMALADAGLQYTMETKKNKPLKEGICDAVALALFTQFRHDHGLQ